MQINNDIQAQNLAASVQLKANNDVKTAKPQQAVASVRAKYSHIIEKALKGDDVDPVLVEEAKKFLASGELDNPEIAQKVAEKLLQYGI